MKFLFDMNHPADVHQFKYLIHRLIAKGHKVRVLARDKECTYDLLQYENIEFIPRKGYKGWKKIPGLFIIDYLLFNVARKFKPDILVGSSGNSYIAQVGWLLRKPAIIFDDTEFSTLQNYLTFPFATEICTPACYTLELGKKQIRYPGYKELAYLHPNVFKPNPAVLKKLNLSPTDKFVIIRMVDLQATHDIGHSGVDHLSNAVKKLEKYARVFISSERPLSKSLEKYRIDLHPAELHHLLSHAALLYGESATLAGESAVLGVPAIFISTSHRGYTDDMESKYKLCFTFDGKSRDKEGLKKAVSILKDGKTKRVWKQKRAKMLEDNKDITRWMFHHLEAL